MRQDLIQTIRQLSAADKKNLTGRLIKLMEEGGELASVAAPYSGEQGTLHRFVTSANILEELADCTLTVLSILYHIGYDEEDLYAEMHRKSDYWAELQFNELQVSARIPFEIHVTVAEAPSAEQFRAVCHSLGVKPILLELQRAQGGPLGDVMTSSVYHGDNAGATREMDRIATGLAAAGLQVVRKKIETVPWHPAAPSDTHKSPEMPKGCYFECHFNVRLPADSADAQQRLAALARAQNCHLSRNVFKRYTDGSCTVMLTYRCATQWREAFTARVAELRTILADDGFALDKEIVEFSIYDTNQGHDASWLSGLPGSPRNPAHEGRLQ